MIDFDGEPHLMDFGLARRNVGEVTMTIDGQVLGTPAYMSPEQARGQARHADRRSDVYSLGGVLFRVLTGELPVSRQCTDVDLSSDQRRAAESAEAQQPNSKRLGDDYTKVPGKGSGATVPGPPMNWVADLKRFRAGEAIHARPVGRLEHAWRWAKRNPAITVLAVLLAVVIARWICRHHMAMAKSGNESGRNEPGARTSAVGRIQGS